jgi:serine/threonine protein phosphatase 1
MQAEHLCQLNVEKLKNLTFASMMKYYKIMRTFAIGDIHGQLSALERLLEEIPIDWQADELVFMGDMIDRGPKPRLVLEFVRQLQANSKRVHVLRGNHEQVMIESYMSKKSFDFWLRMGAGTTYKDYYPKDLRPDWSTFVKGFSADLREYLYRLPIFYRNEHATFVHAGARRVESGNWEIDSTDTALWYREREFWAEYKGGSLVVGHTPTNKIRKMLGEPLMPDNAMAAWQRENLIAIDCGAGHGGQLCAVELPARRFYYQPVPATTDQF